MPDLPAGSGAAPLSREQRVIDAAAALRAVAAAVGLDANRMPVGLQLMGPPRAEARLIGIALGIEALIGQGHALLGAPDLP